MSKELLQSACAKFLDALTSSVPDVMEAFKSRRKGLCTECVKKEEEVAVANIEKACLAARIDSLKIVAEMFKDETSERIDAFKAHILKATEDLKNMG